MTIVDRWGHGDFLVLASPVEKALIFEPVADTGPAAEASDRRARRCETGDKVADPPRLIGQAASAPRHHPGVVDPRLCLRIGTDGRVLSARVLTSSRNNAVDRDVEAAARTLRFRPAFRDRRAVPATVTYDAVGIARD